MTKLDDVMIELLEFCLGSSIKASYVPSYTEISPSYGSYTAVFKYNSWILRVNTECNYVDKLDKLEDNTKVFTNFRLIISTYAKYGKKDAQQRITKEYLISGESHVGVVASLTNSFKDFEDFVRMTIYDMKKSGEWDEPTMGEDIVKSVIENSDESDKLDVAISLLKENNALLKENNSLLKDIKKVVMLSV